MRTFHTPILFLLFNRKETAIQVFTEIRKVQPSYLFLAADGGRDALEHQKCLEVRESILSMIDWECELKTYFRDENAGCGKNVSEAITWFFDHVEEGIILEDDCLPHVSFFSFCEQMLTNYRSEAEVFAVSGSNFVGKNFKARSSFYFSKYIHVWGWATWKRSWKHYNFDFKDWNTDWFDKNNTYTFYEGEKLMWENNFQQTLEGKIDTWDYQLQWTCWRNTGKCIIPKNNLISNIGFNNEATHTKNKNVWYANQKTSNIKKIIHPSKKEINTHMDNLVFKNVYLDDLKSKTKYSLRDKFYLFRMRIKRLINHFPCF